MEEALPLDASCEEIDVDEHLSFLDDFVSQALARGAKKYVPQSQRAVYPQSGSGAEDLQQQQKKGIRFEAYERPKLIPDSTAPPLPSTFTAPVSEAAGDENVLIADLPTPEAASSPLGGFDSGKSLPDVKKKWGKTGYLNKGAEQPPPSQAPAQKYEPSQERVSVSTQSSMPSAVSTMSAKVTGDFEPPFAPLIFIIFISSSSFTTFVNLAEQGSRG